MIISIKAYNMSTIKPEADEEYVNTGVGLHPQSSAQWQKQASSIDIFQ